MRAPEEQRTPKWIVTLVAATLWVWLGLGALLILVGVVIVVKHPGTEGLGALVGAICGAATLSTIAYVTYRMQMSRIRKGYRVWPPLAGLIDLWRYLHGEPPRGR